MSIAGAGRAWVVAAEADKGRERIAACGKVEDAAVGRVTNGAGGFSGTLVSRGGVAHPVTSRAVTPAAMRTLLCMPETISSAAW
jgi:hypothetical protein